MYDKSDICINVSLFFKQKTADEVRISDWSSDVCSSDLEQAADVAHERGLLGVGTDHDPGGVAEEEDRQVVGVAELHEARRLVGPVGVDGAGQVRSEERRVGKVCVSTCSSRGSRYPSKIKNECSCLKQSPTPL